MKKTILLVSFLAIALVGTLYSLPKTVVDTKDLNEGVTSAQSPEADHDEAKHEGEEAGAHAPTALTADQIAKIDPLRVEYRQAASEGKAKAAVSLSDAFAAYQMFDSAAFYAERAAVLVPSLDNQLRAGDRYYSAYGFATDEKKAGKTRRKNPGLLPKSVGPESGSAGRQGQHGHDVRQHADTHVGHYAASGSTRG